jgi:flagellar biosynthesis protein FlhG
MFVPRPQLGIQPAAADDAESGSGLVRIAFPRPAREARGLADLAASVAPSVSRRGAPTELAPDESSADLAEARHARLEFFPPPSRPAPNSSQVSGLLSMVKPVAVKDGPRARVRGRATRIAVTSGKGGVGKSQVSANLATLFGARGQRVLLCDTDLGLASLDLLLGVFPRYDLLEVVRGVASLAEVRVAGPPNVDLVPASPGRAEMANIGPVERSRILDALSEIEVDYDIVLVDTGAGIGSTSVEFARTADIALVVTTPDPTALRDAYAMVKTLIHQGGFSRLTVVVNQTESEHDGLAAFERLRALAKRFLSVELTYAGAIPRDLLLPESAALGQPFVLRAPQSSAARAMDHVVRRLSQEIARQEC